MCSVLIDQKIIKHYGHQRNEIENNRCRNCGHIKSLVQQYLFPGKREWHLPRTVGIVDFLDGGYPCGNCGKIYKHRGNMRRHMVYECGKQAQFQCVFCCRKFHQQSNLKRHCETQHKIPNNKSLSVLPITFNVK